MKRLRTCITPQGNFQYGIHKPTYTVTNLRQDTSVKVLGLTADKTPINNERNYPPRNLEVKDADWIFEIPNPFPFQGSTYINKKWADASAKKPDTIRLQQPEQISLSTCLEQHGANETLFAKLPPPLLLALATCSTDAEDLVKLAHLSCEIIQEGGKPIGLRYTTEVPGEAKPIIHNQHLFAAVANNPHLPNSYKVAMVIQPGSQGNSAIVGEWSRGNDSHIFEYLRSNSYIPGGHYAANMADDAIRYSVESLTAEDIRGLRHLYYQRTYVRLAEELTIPQPAARRALGDDELESIRLAIITAINKKTISATTIWGWNFGFDYAPSLYRLHASHQQIHQQYGLVPGEIETYSHGTKESTGKMAAYNCGDLLTELIEDYDHLYGNDFFSDYRRAIATNRRMDDRDDLDLDLVVWSDQRVMLFVPKAQTSQWELQLMTLPAPDGSLAGNIVECDQPMRQSLDLGIFLAQKALARIGAKMVTTVEYSKSISKKNMPLHQPLLLAFLPRLPDSPRTFSKAQLRFIGGHYPEDFATVCRKSIDELIKT